MSDPDLDLAHAHTCTCKLSSKKGEVASGSLLEAFFYEGISESRSLYYV